MDNGDDLGTSISSYLSEIQRSLKAAVEAGLNEAAELTIRELEGASPKASGRYARSWINTEGSPDYLAERAAEALEAAGFYGFRFEDASYEENTGLNRIMIEFAYMEI